MLKEILRGTDVVSVVGPDSIGKIAKIELDSRKVGAGDLFVAIRGAALDGHEFIGRAIEAGAACVVCEQLPAKLNPFVTYVQVKDTSEAVGPLASHFYGDPSAKLKVIGVTGTNGKTTTVTLLFDLFRRLGHKVGLISTVVYKINNLEIRSSRTTPDAVSLNRMMAEMVKAGCTYCFMEVSSHSIVQHRIDGIGFAGGIFTNLTHDHLDYHKTFPEYIKAKKGFFDLLPREAFAVTNADDRNGAVMVQNTRARIKTYAVRSAADYRCRIAESLFDGMLLQMDGTELWARFIGEFNAYNLLGVYAAARELGVEQAEALRILSELKPVSGRFENYTSPAGVVGIVDYAHTPDALDNVLRTLHRIRRDGQRIITVVGCGGNRDRSKRPIMARMAIENSDFTILTSDNPRFEEPGDILAEMAAGADPNLHQGKFVSIADRREAIKMAFVLARGVEPETAGKGEKGDIILIAGKGHENYQEIRGIKHHFDDREELLKLFRK